MTRFVVDAYVCQDNLGRAIDTIHYRHYGATQFVSTTGYDSNFDFEVISPQAWAWRCRAMDHVRVG